MCIETDSHNDEITLKGLDGHQQNNECRKRMDALDLLALLAVIAVCALLCLITCQSFHILSPWATSCVEEVASTGPGIRFFQLYVSLIYILHFPLFVSELYCILSVFFYATCG